MKRVLNRINSSSKKILSIVNKHKKKLIIGLCAFIMLFISSFLYINLTNPTKINRYIAHVINKGNPANNAFEDENFYNAIVDAYNTQNKTSLPYTTNLTDEQLQTITYLEYSGSRKSEEEKIINPQGIEKLINIISLYLGSNDLTSIDLSKNTKLENLVISSNQLTKINIEENTRLNYLNLSYNNLTNIDVSKNTKLSNFDISNNFLTDLNVNNNTALIKLVAYKNQLSSIELDGAKNLKYLVLTDNKLININIKNNKALVGLYLESNNLMALDVGNNDYLEKLYVTDNFLENIILENKTSLKELVIGGIKLACIKGGSTLSNVTSFEKGNNITKINLSALNNLEKIYLSYNQISRIDISKNTSLSTFVADHNQLTNIDISKNVSLAEVILPYNKLNSINTKNNMSLSTLNVAHNQLVSMDLSKNTKLDNIYLNGNKDLEEKYFLKKGNKYNYNKIILPDSLYSKVKVSDSNIIGFNKGTITASKSGTATVNYYGAGIPVNVYDISSNKYIINDANKYIYTGSDISSDTILSNMNLENISGRVENNKLILYSGDTTVDEYNLINISSNKYDLSKKYVYIGINEFDDSDINVTNGTFEINDNKLNIKYEDKVLDTKKIVSINSDTYDLTKNYIYDLNGSFDINNINCTNCNVTLENGKVKAKYEDTILQEWDLVSINLESSLYDLSKDYIYIGTDKFDSSKIDSTNITFEEHDNLVDLKYNDEIIKSYKLVSVSSDEYDISGKMINVYSNSFDKTKINVINGTFTVANNTVTIKYDNDVLDNFKIVGLSSLKYDLTKDYILLKNDEKIDLSLINTANVTLDLKENSLDVLYEDEVIKTYKIVRYSSSKYDLTKDYIYIGTKELDVNDITVINGEVLLENNILYIKYQEDVLGSYKVIGVKSNDYSIGNDYIYTKNNSFDKTKVSVSNGNIETSSNKVIIKYENTKLDEFNIVSISSNKYDLTKEYIYLGLSKFDNSKITYTNCEGIVENDVLNIKYNNKTLDSYKLAYISSDKYNLEKEYVYTGMSGIDITKINATNLALENINNNLNIKYNDEIVDTRKIVSYSSNVYDLTKDYIYIGFNDFNKDNVNVINGVTEYSNNLLKIKYGNDILKTYEVSSISSSKYDLSKKYIYVGTENLDKTHINNINNTLEVKDGMLNVKYEDDILQSYKIVKISSSKYDLSKDNIRIYKNEEFDIKSITVENGLKEYKDDKLYIKYNDDILKVYTISTRAKGDITGDDKITIADVSLLYRHVRKTKVITDSETLEISDLTGDGKITIADVAKLYRYVRGKITEL